MEGKKNNSWSGRKYSVYQSTPSAALQISAMALSCLNNDDLIVLGDHWIPQLNDAKAINTFSSQYPEIIRFFLF